MKKFILYLILGIVLFGLPFIAYTSEENFEANTKTQELLDVNTDPINTPDKN